MNRFNHEITDMLLEKFKGLSIEHTEGRFLADKSYAFDTIFFAARFIARFRFGKKFRKLDLREKSSQYFQDLYCLRQATQIPNYMTEAVALFRFTGILKRIDQNLYEITDEDLLDFTSSSFENAYIFLYMLCYCVFKNDGIWELYIKFCQANDKALKQQYYDKIRGFIATHDPRIRNAHKLWALFIPKYPMVVLNYANRQNMIARTGKVRTQIVERTDISVNVKGTRANSHLPKKNAYLQEMSDSYIIETLRPFLAVSREDLGPVQYTDSFSIDVADTKLDMLDTDNATSEWKRKMQQNRYKRTNSGVVRTVQGEFRNGLFSSVPPVCPVCGFHYKKFLIASHIKPYSKCDDTYDAMNPNNGFLMCPICDKLFESGNYITIHSRTGQIIYDSGLEGESDFEYLKGGKIIPVDYIDCERKHYLIWHNEEFFRKHPDHALAPHRHEHH